jgi:hypothetical protein
MPCQMPPPESVSRPGGSQPGKEAAKAELEAGRKFVSPPISDCRGDYSSTSSSSSSSAFHRFPPLPSTHPARHARPLAARSQGEEKKAGGAEGRTAREREREREKEGNLGGFPFREILGRPVRAAPGAGGRASALPQGPPRLAPGNVWPSFAAANAAVWIGRILLTRGLEPLAGGGPGLVAALR